MQCNGLFLRVLQELFTDWRCGGGSQRLDLSDIYRFLPRLDGCRYFGGLGVSQGRIDVTMIRFFAREDAFYLPEIERSAGRLFETLPDLAWLTEDAVTSAQQHVDDMAGGLCWVAFDDAKRRIAFLSAEIMQDTLHIWEVSVHAASQRQGIGRALIEHAAAYATLERLNAVTLTTFRDVAWNEPYYQRLGFETLEDEALGDRLRATLKDEGTRGLPVARRCAMRRMLALAPVAV
jgi:GNAT superfamily N-acetyltransferase